MVDISEKESQPEVIVLPLKPLRQVRVIKGKLEEVLEQGCGRLCNSNSYR